MCDRLVRARVLPVCDNATDFFTSKYLKADWEGVN